MFAMMCRVSPHCTSVAFAKKGIFFAACCPSTSPNASNSFLSGNCVWKKLTVMFRIFEPNTWFLEAINLKTPQIIAVYIRSNTLDYILVSFIQRPYTAGVFRVDMNVKGGIQNSCCNFPNIPGYETQMA
jgi:hypothetical protein